MQRTAPPGSLGLDETLDTEDEGTLPAPKAAARRASSEKPAPEGTEFTGNERFELRRRLGAGGFGVVYEAWDRQRNLRVALKTLARIDPVALYQFKQEFRTLADIQHPHLVVFYELLSSAGHWFFTMELLEGLGLLEYVRPHLVAAPIVEDSTAAALFQSTLENPMTMTAPAVGAAASDAPRPAPVTSLPPLDEERVRLAFRQIAEGVAALHAIGKLHHDLKPSNVRVTNDGRVVLLDFGLARDLVPRASSAAGSAPLGDGRGAPADTERTASGSMANTHTLDGHLAGTPMYMAPERLTGVPVTEASDWYSVGIMLYEVLAGRQPFEGSMEEILRERLRREPPPPSVFAPTAPADLVSLCRDLLRMDPSRRPAGPEILQRLAAAQPADRPRLWAPSPRSQIFIGREAELAALGEALAATRRSPPQSGAPSGPQARPQRQPVILHVHGPSGMGKSALVQHFLADLQARDEAVVLGGRCYERESFPYKALDSAMDALARYLTRLPEAQVEGLLPPHLRTLTRLFPVLERIPAIERAAAAEAEVIDPQEQRRRAVAALRQLLVRLAERSPVVLALDDLQWGDLDSADLLGELLRVPQAPAVLLIASYRSDEVETSPFLRSLLASRALADVEVR
ncbi:MAG TPA: serine/threonine-protein kinase, partial [Polyangia bacterium]|nr:serine/threonine-protein kinase [Polyangia bacterium]